MSRGRNARGASSSPTYDVLDASGRVLIDGDHVEYAGEATWDRVDPTTPAEVRAALVTDRPRHVRELSEPGRRVRAVKRR